MRINKTITFKVLCCNRPIDFGLFFIQLLISQSANLNKKNSNPNYIEFIRVKDDDNSSREKKNNT